MSSVFRTDRHLASPVLDGELEFVKKYADDPTSLKGEHRLLLRNEGLKILEYDWFRFQADLLEHIESNPSYEPKQKPSLSRSLRAGLKALELNLARCLSSSVATNCLKLKPCDIITEEITHWNAWKRWFSSAYGEVGMSSRMMTTVSSPGLSATFYGDLVVIKIGRKGKIRSLLGTYSMWLAVQSCVESHEGALLYSKIADLYKKYPGTKLYTEVERFLRAGRTDLYRLGNSVAQVWKAIPSMAIAVVLESHEQVMDLSFTKLVREGAPIVTESRLFRYMMTPVASDESAKVRLEVAGLWKSFGFPVVDSQATAEDLRTRMTEPPNVNRVAADACRNMFRKVFCRSFFSRYGRWPLVILTEDVLPSIRRSVEKNAWLETGNSGWSASDFSAVLLDKNLDYDYSIDTSDLLTDKAVCTGRDDFIVNFDRHAYEVIHNKPAPRSKGRETRVLTQFLCHENLNVRQVIECIESGDVPERWLGMVAVIKEKEGKIDNARCFCKLTAEMRLYQTSTERNIATRVFPFIRHQSMTMGEKELLETISTMTAPFGDASCKYGFISLDYSRWCLTMTLDSCLPLFTELDCLFGLCRVFSFSQVFPYLCQVIVQDRYRPPEFIGDEAQESRTSWNCSSRWMEGMRQKGWTLQTQATILEVAEERGTTATLLGQGDNQVIVVEIPPAKVLERLNESASEFISSFVNSLANHSAELGMILKPEETWTSTVLFEYSKLYHFKGSCVSSALKRASRVSSYSNDGIKTFSNRISSLFSSGMSVAGVDAAPQISFLLTLVLVCDCIVDEYRNMSDMELLSLLCTPACVGGLPVGLLSDFMFRGKMDDLTDAIHWIVFLSSECPELYNVMSKLINLEPSSRRDLDLLIMNPYSLNLNTPITAENVIRRRVKEDLPRIVVNEEVRHLFGVESQTQRRGLINDLLTMVPFNPRVASHLYKLSNISLADKIVGQYSSSRTVRQALERAEDTIVSETDFKSLISAMDSAIESHLISSLRHGKAKNTATLLLNPDSSCSMQTAIQLRNKSWCLELEGASMPSTLEQCILTRWDSAEIDPGRTITIDIDDKPDLLTSRGRFKPYVGSLTQTRTRKSNLSLIDSSCMVTSLKKITEMLSWIAASDSNLAELLRCLCQEKTSIDVTDLQRVTRQVVGGSVQHRLADEASPRGAMINGLYNLASHARVCTDSALEFAKESTDYTLCFQAVILCCLSRLSIMSLEGVDVRGRWAACIRCRGCTVEVGASNFDLAEKPNYSGLPLGMKINEVRVSGSENTESVGVVSARDGLAYYIADRWASHLSNWEARHLESVEKSVVTDSTLPGFVNLTEMSLMHLATFEKALCVYLFLRYKHVSRAIGGLNRLLSYGTEDSAITQLGRALIMSGHWSSEGHSHHIDGQTSVLGVSVKVYQKICKNLSDPASLMNYLFLPSSCDGDRFDDAAETLSVLFESPPRLVRPESLQDESVYTSNAREMARRDRAKITKAESKLVPRIKCYPSRYLRVREPTGRELTLTYHETYEWSTGAWIYGNSVKELQDILFLKFPKMVDRIVSFNDPGGEICNMLLHRVVSQTRPIIILPEGALSTAIDFNVEPCAMRSDRCEHEFDQPETVRHSITQEFPEISVGDLVVLNGAQRVLTEGVDLLCLTEDLFYGEIERVWKCILGVKFWVTGKSSNSCHSVKKWTRQVLNLEGVCRGPADTISVASKLSELSELRCCLKEEEIKADLLLGASTPEEASNFLIDDVKTRVSVLSGLSKTGVNRKRAWTLSHTHGSKRGRLIQHHLDGILLNLLTSHFLCIGDPSFPRVVVHLHHFDDHFKVCWVPNCPWDRFYEADSRNVRMRRSDLACVWRLGRVWKLSNQGNLAKAFGSFTWRE